ncbi:MAG: DUF4157 domain-containing protein [Roseivirga sp.]|nr:DUF4157 domain-containing protein [Roseivirga sp.]
MAEVKTAPISKPSNKASAKAVKTKPAVQTKPGPNDSLEKLIQPFLQTNRPIGSETSFRNGTSTTSGLWKNSIQTRLKVGQPGDKYEQEADAVADQVVTNPRPEISKQADKEQLSQKPEIQRSAVAEEEIQASQEEEPELQASTEEEPEVQSSPEEEDQVQAMPGDTDQAEDGLIQSKDGSTTVSQGFESKLDSAKAGGTPLPQSTISKVEPHVNADLSGVRVHTDSNAVQLNQSLGAQAFANQNHIFFNEGKYNPGTTAGDHLIAHEATHTVQQGASLKKKPVEEEAPEDINMSAAEPATAPQQAAVPPADNPPPADSNASANTGSPSDSPAQTGGADAPQTPSGSTDTAGAGNPPVSPPAASGTGGPPVTEPQEDLQKENPITQRAASYQEEEVSEVKALGMEGNSEQAMASFTGAGASQVAMAFPTMGDTLNQKLGAEKQSASTDAPKLTAGTNGVKDQKTKNANDPGNGTSASLNDGITEAEPGALQLEPHQEGAPLPSYKVDDKLDKGKPAKEESGGFFSWLFDKFKNLMGGINTQDAGLNTKAGASPKIDTKGKANPQRAENQSKEAKDQVNKEKQESAKEINNNPGQQNIQPLFFEEPKEVVIDATLQSTATTGEDQAMADFVTLPLPESVRRQTDLDLAPKMEKTLAKPRQETQAAAQKRDTDKQKAINEKQAEVEKMNKDAEKQQQDLVDENRNAIAAEQKKGVEEAETQMNAFSSEADKEKAKANKDVNTRIKKDQAEGEKKLKDAEGEAATKKKEGEKQAKTEKEAAKKNSKDKSWWGKFKDAVSSAVSWVTEKIGKIFDAIRKAVKFIIDKAKKAALALIEAGRKWIIDKLDKFGSWLKEKANKYLKHFPALRKRVNAFIDKTVDGAKKLVNKVADGLKKGVEALANALGKAINSVLSAFEGVLTAAVQFAGAMLKGDFAEALKIAFMATCKVAGIDPTPILNFINKAGETIGIIFKNPAAFFGHVAGGVKLGIDQFVKNIKKHLISGLISWLTGAMSDVPIQLPEKFDLKGIFSLVMQILGLTYDRIRAKVVKRIGPKGEQVVSGMEKTFQFVKDLITKGPIALWERIKDKFTEIKEMAMEKIRNLVTIEVVKAGIKWLIGLLNPASAIVKAVLMLYDFVMFLVERKDQIIGFVTAVFDTVGPLARGQIKKAGNAVEGAMGRGVPVILGLLANLAGLGGIGKSVSKVIKTIQKPVDKVVDPIIGWLVKQGKKLYGKGKGVYDKGKKKLKDLKNRFVNWAKNKKGFKDKSGKSHEIFYKTKGKKAELWMASAHPKPMTDWIKVVKNDKTATEGSALGRLKTLYGEIEGLEKGIESIEDTPENKTKIEGIQNTIQQKINLLPDLINEANIIQETVTETSNVTFQMNGSKAGIVIANPLTKFAGNTQGQVSSKADSSTGSNPLSWTDINSTFNSALEKTEKLFGDAPSSRGYETGYNSDNQPVWRKKDFPDKTVYARQVMRAHVLNNNLHGPAQTWNLVPSSYKFNSKMERDAEKPLKTRVEAGEKLKVKFITSYKSGTIQNKDNQAQTFSKTPFIDSIKFEAYKLDGSSETPITIPTIKDDQDPILNMDADELLNLRKAEYANDLRHHLKTKSQWQYTLYKNRGRDFSHIPDKTLDEISKMADGPGYTSADDRTNAANDLDIAILDNQESSQRKTQKQLAEQLDVTPKTIENSLGRLRKIKLILLALENNPSATEEELIMATGSASAGQRIYNKFNADRGRYIDTLGDRIKKLN